MTMLRSGLVSNQNASRAPVVLGRSETKGVVGGYALVEVASREEALKVAQQFVDLHRVHWPAFDGECEQRP
jgi:hypothetical protein